MTATQSPDPIALVAALKGDDIRRRLADVEAERKALIALLRSVSARERAAARRHREGAARA